MAPPRVSWHGTLSLGLLSIPVGLAPATEEKSKASNVAFKQVHKQCLTPIKLPKWCPECDCALKPDDVGKGYLREKGEPLVLVDEDALAALQADESRAMEIHSFCHVGSIDPIWFDRTYYLYPQEGPAKGYVLLLRALQAQNYGALCQYVRSGQERWGIVRPLGDILGMDTLYLAEDVRRAQIDVDYVPGEDEQELADELVERMSEPFNPDVLVSTYRQDLHEMLASLAKPKKAKAKAPVKTLEETTLMQLRATVAEVKKQKKKAA